MKYAFIHLESHRLHVKASLTSLQFLSFLNLLINSTYKLDISESIQCTSQEKCNTTLHCNNTNHIPTTIKIVADKDNKTMQWKEEIRSTLEETRKQHLQNEFSTSMVIPFLPKFGALGVPTSRLSHERGGLHRAVWKAVGSIHYPIDLFTQWYATGTKVLHQLHVAKASVDGYRVREHVGREKFPFLSGLACE